MGNSLKSNYYILSTVGNVFLFLQPIMYVKDNFYKIRNFTHVNHEIINSFIIHVITHIEQFFDIGPNIFFRLIYMFRVFQCYNFVALNLDYFFLAVINLLWSRRTLPHHERCGYYIKFISLSCNNYIAVYLKYLHL